MPPRLSVIIPTHRRVDALEACLASLAGQTVPTAQFEVLVVDDGSPEEEHAHLHQLRRERFGEMVIDIRWQRQAGPARARNDAIRRAVAPLVLILNDDVTLAPDHLAAHLRAHAEAPGDEVVFRGLTRWSEDTPDTPVMRWMRETSFRYDWELFHPVEAHFVHFHTCDLSAKRALLVRFPFDESFPEPCCEDTDLALRLLKAGMLDLRLLPEARSRHHHVHDLAAVRRRAQMQGRSMAKLIERHPELEYRLRSGYLDQASMRRRRLRVLRRRLFGPWPLYLTALHDCLMLREIERLVPRPERVPPYPQALLDTLLD
jgi:GT2 family glycosyltransferase